MHPKEILNFYNIYRERLPVYVIFYVTSRCNYRCRMCFYWKEIENPNKDELNLEEIEKISKNFGKLLQLSLTGGEPFLRDDLPEICKIFIGNNRPNYITIPTNASMPERIREVTEKIISQNPNTFFRIPLSLDGLREEHNAIRGNSEAFDNVLKTYKELDVLRKKFANLTLDINAAYSSFNQEKIDDTIDFVENNLDVDNLSITLARGNVKNGRVKDVSLENYERVIKRLMSLNRQRESRSLSSIIRTSVELTWETIRRTLRHKRMVIPCLAGKRLIIISEKGDVFPCEILNTKMGNLREAGYDIRKIIHSAAAKRILSEIKNKKCYCTFECAIITSLIFNKLQCLKIAARALLRRQQGNIQ